MSCPTLQTCTVPQLKTALRKAGLSTSGLKAELFARLSSLSGTTTTTKKSTTTKKTTAPKKSTTTKKTTAPKKTTTTKKTTAAKKRECAKLRDCTVAQLKVILTQAGLATSGRKADLFARLSSSGGETNTPTPKKTAATMAPKKRECAKLRDCTVAQLKAVLTKAGLATSGRKADLFARLSSSGGETNTTTELDVFKPIGSHATPDLSGIPAAADPQWRRIYMGFQAEKVHPRTTSTKLSRSDLELTPIMSDHGPALDIRQPFPTNFAKRATRTQLHAFLSSYYGDVFALVAARTTATCPLITYAPKYLETRYRLDDATFMSIEQKIRVDRSAESVTVDATTLASLRRLMRGSKPFVVRVSLTKQKVGRVSKHANALLINPRTHTAMLFESHGLHKDDVHKPLGGWLSSTLSVTLHGLETRHRLQSKDRLCASWSLYYIMMRLVNPDVEGYYLVQSMTRGNLARLLAWITFDIPQQKPCLIGAKTTGRTVRAETGETLGRAAMMQTSGLLVQRVMSHKSKFDLARLETYV